MKYLLLILSTSILLSAEMEVDGDLKVVGNVQVGTIDSLEQEIVSLKLIIAQLQTQITLLEFQIALIGGDLGYAEDCNGVIAGAAILDDCGVCNGNNESKDICGVCGGDAISESECYPVYDYDGNGYTTIQIGNQLWMAENLKVTRYNDGSEIQYVQEYSSEPFIWDNLSYDPTGAYGYYDDDPSHLDTYGNLYNWYVVDDDRGVCPEGWHVPSSGEYFVLRDYLGGTSVAGGKMKEAGLDHWDSPNTGATNESGFTGLPGGYRSIGGSDNSMGSKGYFWSSSVASYTNLSSWWSGLYDDDDNYHWSGSSRLVGYSIRCLGD